MEWGAMWMTLFVVFLGTRQLMIELRMKLAFQRVAQKGRGVQRVDAQKARGH